MLQHREKIMKQLFHYQNESSIHIPVAFSHIILNIKNQCQLTTQTMSDITPLEIYNQLEYYIMINFGHCARVFTGTTQLYSMSFKHCIKFL